MIKNERVIINAKEFVRTYSDRNKMIERDGVMYAEAIDPIELGSERSYTETEVDIEQPEDAELAEDELTQDVSESETQ